ncbi:MAG: 23S rRNA (pseudouridine(1915)-N(3))-methyltransferase RlmH [Clostridia bacterium]|nr:23S rRNA (pseudouridine(1915)-N(3))-methyltransferase RlmH [Clostridia bacterium]
MTSITIISLGTLKEDYLKSGVAEYQKRLSAYAQVSEINLPEERIQNENDPASISRALEKEGDAILSRIPKGAVTVALCVEGKELDSPELAAFIARAGESSGKLAFIIGSSHGLSPRVKAAADLRLSISRMTFPHQLMRLILSEALYRAATITAGKRYHK